MHRLRNEAKGQDQSQLPVTRAGVMSEAEPRIKAEGQSRGQMPNARGKVRNQRPGSESGLVTEDWRQEDRQGSSMREQEPGTGIDIGGRHKQGPMQSQQETTLLLIQTSCSSSWLKIM